MNALLKTVDKKDTLLVKTKEELAKTKVELQKYQQETRKYRTQLENALVKT
jgi:hypothetical protein